MKWRKGLLALMSAYGASVGTAHAVDAQANDYVPAGPDSKFLAFYYLLDNFQSYKPVGGARIKDDTELQTSVGVLRYVNYFTVGDMLANWQIYQVFGSFDKGKIGGSQLSDSGSLQLGNTTVLAGIWPLVDRERGRYVNIAGYLNFPTGRYDRDRALNLGDNRYSQTLQMGYHHELTSNFSIELVSDITRYGKNDDYGPLSATLTQRNTFQNQIWGIWSVKPGAAFSIGYSDTSGGRSYADGVFTGNKTSRSQYRMSYSQSIGEKLLFLVELDRDARSDGGFGNGTGLRLRFIHLL